MYIYIEGKEPVARKSKSLAEMGVRDGDNLIVTTEMKLPFNVYSDEEEDGGGDEDYGGERAGIVLDGKCLESINPSEIFVIDFSKYCKEIKVKYFRCIVPEQSYQIIQCPNCQLLFQRDEYEVALINNGHLCPFCRYKFAT